MQGRGIQPDDILILLRSDRNGAFSRPIREKLEEADITVAATDELNPLDSDQARAFLAFLRLAVGNMEDSLAWRTLLQVWCQVVGEKAIGAVYDLARNRDESFAQTLIAAHANKDILPTNHRSRLFQAIDKVLNQLKVIFPEETDKKYTSSDELINVIQSAAECIISTKEERDIGLTEIRAGCECT